MRGRHWHSSEAKFARSEIFRAIKFTHDEIIRKHDAATIQGGDTLWSDGQALRPAGTEVPLRFRL